MAKDECFRSEYTFGLNMLRTGRGAWKRIIRPTTNGERRAFRGDGIEAAARPGAVSGLRVAATLGWVEDLEVCEGASGEE